MKSAERTAAQEKAAFSERLKTAIRNFDENLLSPTALAREFNRRSKSNTVAVTGAHKWLTGESIPQQQKLVVLAAWLGVSVQRLRFGAAGDTPAPSDKEQKLTLPLFSASLIHFIRLGEYEEALSHLDQVVFSEQQRGRISSVIGWRINALFNQGDARSAFRGINNLIPQADRLKWIWPWCLRLVATFGRANVKNARQAAPFWKQFVKANPTDSHSRWELLMTTFYLRGKGEDVGKSYDEFRNEFDRHIAYVDPQQATLPWDRLGHWAQDNEDWTEAERCFRKAYDLERGEYGYCLAIALKRLERFDESVTLLLEQAQTIQPDAWSWFELAGAYVSLGNSPAAIDAYERAISIDPNHAMARFDLGGTHWNDADVLSAMAVWKEATTRFPDHELSAKLKRKLPMLLGDRSQGNREPD